LRQADAFPIQLIQEDPANLGTADAALFADGANGLQYCVKTCATAPHAPAAEFICNGLASLCKLPIASYDLVRLLDGTLAFGSVWDGSALLDHAALFSLLTGSSPGRQIPEVVSAAYAFDLFVHNTDRHVRNYLGVSGRTAGHSIKLYDFSRAFTAHGWPLPALPMDAAANTIVTHRQLLKHHTFDLAAAKETMERLRKVTHQSFKGLFDAMPEAWLDTQVRIKVLKWWAGPREARINQIVKGLTDGTLL
jgi:hypothetical protein